MRALTPPLQGHSLDQAHARPPQDPKQAASRWQSLNDKSAVLQRLLKNQYQLCGYSEVDAIAQGWGYHIEHIENKSQQPARTFDETNLLASALKSDDLKGWRKGDIFGGHAAGKSQHVDMGLFIHPYQPDCTKYFAYLSDGRIVPAYGLSHHEIQQAQYTIDLLNLDCALLRELRQQRWQELEDLEVEHLTKGWELETLIELELTDNGRALSPFYSLTKQFFGV